MLRAKILSRVISSRTWVSRATAKELLQKSRINYWGKKTKKLALSLRRDHFLRTQVYLSFLSEEKRSVPQLEIFILLSLRGRHLVRPPQVARYRLSLEVCLRKHGSRGTPPLFAEEYLCPSESGETRFASDLTILMPEFQLGMQPLCDRAFIDIKHKLSLDNIVGEVFSPFTSS